MADDAPPELPVAKALEYPLLTRVAALWMWSLLSLIALTLTLSGIGPENDSFRQFQYYLMSFPATSIGQGGVSTPNTEWVALLSPLSLLIAYTALAFTWIYLYRFFRVFVVPVAFLNGAAPERGVDPRQVIAVRSLRMSAALIGFAAIARAVPYLIIHLLPHLLHAGV